MAGFAARPRFLIMRSVTTIATTTTTTITMTMYPSSPGRPKNVGAGLGEVWFEVKVIDWLWSDPLMSTVPVEGLAV